MEQGTIEIQKQTRTTYCHKKKGKEGEKKTQGIGHTQTHSPEVTQGVAEKLGGVNTSLVLTLVSRVERRALTLVWRNARSAVLTGGLRAVREARLGSLSHEVPLAVHTVEGHTHLARRELEAGLALDCQRVASAGGGKREGKPW